MGVTYFTVKAARCEYNQEIGTLRNALVSWNSMIRPYLVHPPEYRDPDPRPRRRVVGSV